MSSELAKSALALSKAIQDEVNEFWLPPADGLSSRRELVLAKSLVKGTRGYIEIVANQINSTYENGSYDASAVMIRRLVETLIIEVFEHHNIVGKIKDQKGDFLPLSDLVTSTLNEPTFNFDRSVKAALKALPNLKWLGDLSAHNWRFNAHRSDIDQIKPSLRIIVQVLIYVAGLK